MHDNFFQLEKMVIHPSYNQHSKVYDVALLFLKEDANFTSPRVRPICLWNDDYDLDKLKDKRGTVHLNTRHDLK